MARRVLGDTHHFCPVALKTHNVLVPCTDKTAAKYREKTFYFSSPDARESFIQNPAQFVAQTEPLKVRAERRKERKRYAAVRRTKIILSSSIQAPCPTDLAARHQRVGQDDSRRMACEETWALPHSVQGAAPDARHGQDNEARALCRRGDVLRGSF